MRASPKSTRGAGRPPLRAARLAASTWLARQLLTIALAHAVALVSMAFVLLLGDTLYAGYATLVRDAVVASNAAHLTWLQRMASDVYGASPSVVGLSAALQMLLLASRVTAGRAAPRGAATQPWGPDFSFDLARALRAVGVGLVGVASVSILQSALGLNADSRAYGLAIAAVAGVGIAHRFTRLPPSAAVTLASES